MKKTDWILPIIFTLFLAFQEWQHRKQLEYVCNTFTAIVIDMRVPMVIEKEVKKK